MALTRRSGQRMNGAIWPGFVDAMTALLLVLMFVLSIFMIVQSVLRDTIDTQDNELDALTQQVSSLADALGLERDRAAGLQTEIGQLSSDLATAAAEGQTQVALIASLSGQLEARGAELAAATAQITSFEAQVATLLAQRDTARGEAGALTVTVAELESARTELLTQQEALNLALASARQEIDTQLEAARLVAARREALDAMIADLQNQVVAGEASLTDTLARLTAAEGTTEAQRADLVALAAELAEGQASLADALARLTAAEGTAETRRADLAALAAQLAEAENAVTSGATQTTALTAQIAELQKNLVLAESASADADALRARMAELEASLTEAERAKLAQLAAAETLRRRLAATETSLSAEETALLAERAAVEALRRRLVTTESSLTQEEAALLAERAAAAALRERLASVEALLSEEEQARLTDLAAAETLRARLAASDTELTAMTLALEEQRKRAEDTLTLLAAAQAATTQTDADLQGREALLAIASAQITAEQKRTAESARRVALLNEQVAALRGQLGELQGLLDAASARDRNANVRLDALGSQLNTALAQVASEQKRRADLEETERKRLEAETKKLENFRSEFFGQLREVLAGREGVRIVGDRFVFSSEVLFDQGAANLAEEGQVQIAGVVATLREISDQIPADIDWILRVDGHTDTVPLSGTGAFADNWELSQARALSVVRFMQEVLGFPPNRMAATGFGEWQPVALADTEAARAQNRRIELKLTER
jgi:chemotaxis protein MotB